MQTDLETAEPGTETTVDIGISGYTRPERYIAAVVDNSFAVLLVMIVAANVSENLEPSGNVTIDATIGFGLLLLYFGYFLIFESALSATPGKLMFSLRVLHLDGTRCSWKAAIIRTLTRLLEVNPVVLGCLPAALVVWNSKRKQRWGDILASTVVTDRKCRRP
jgi:uncharacterized RDD family membrane protein YckC